MTERLFISAESWLGPSFPDKITTSILKNLVTSNASGVANASHLASGAMRNGTTFPCSLYCDRIRTIPF